MDCSCRIGSDQHRGPTLCEGGGLVLHNPQGHDSRFDWSSGTDLEAQETPTDTRKESLNYVAFANDVDYSIEQVMTGYRVVVTFGLFMKPVFVGKRLKVRQDEYADAVAAIVALKETYSLGCTRVVFELQYTDDISASTQAGRVCGTLQDLTRARHEKALLLLR